MILCMTPSFRKICKLVVQTVPKCIWELFAFAYAPRTYHHLQINENCFFPSGITFLKIYFSAYIKKGGGGEETMKLA